MFREPSPSQPSSPRVALIALVAALAACARGPASPPADVGVSPGADAAAPGPDAGAPEPDAGGALADAGVVDDPGVEGRARHARVRPKTGAQLAVDLAAALELPRDAVCRELGAYDCATVAHRIVLGGVEPYVLRVDRPLPVSPVTAPIAVDRLALAACGRRVALDFDTPARAVVFGPLARGEPGATDATIDALYDRLLGRAPDAEERALVAELATDASARAFATLSCFVVATSLEHIFDG